MSDATPSISPLRLVNRAAFADAPKFETHSADQILAYYNATTTITHHPGDDGSFRLHFRFADTKETEIAYYKDAPEHAGFPHTLSTSTQIGCVYECNHCDAERIVRNLSSEELFFMNDAALTYAGANDGQPIKIVGLGMGDPGANAAEIIGFLPEIKKKWPTVNNFLASTAGALPGLRKFADAHNGPVPIDVQISLHGSTREQRKKIIPRPDLPLESLTTAGAAYYIKTGRPVIMNCMVIDGFNNAAADAARLRGLLYPPEAFVLKLVKANPIAKSPEWMTQATDAQIHAFKLLAEDTGLNVITPGDSGVKVGGGCGQQRMQDHGNVYSAPFV